MWWLIDSPHLLCRFNDTSFTVNGVKYEGSLLCVGNLLMSWSPRKFSEITTDRYLLSSQAFDSHQCSVTTLYRFELIFMTVFE